MLIASVHYVLPHALRSFLERYKEVIAVVLGAGVAVPISLLLGRDKTKKHAKQTAPRSKRKQSTPGRHVGGERPELVSVRDESQGRPGSSEPGGYEQFPVGWPPGVDSAPASSAEQDDAANWEAGWYPDPYNPAALRYHDGRQWTEYVAKPQRTGTL